MATQAEVISFIKSNLKYEQPDENVFKLLYGTSGGRSQIVMVFVWDTFVSVISPFANTTQITAERAISAAAEHSLLGISRLGDTYCIKHVIPMADVDASEIHVGFELVAEGADELENKLGLGDDY